ncbi:MAG: Asp-tRNA(Asn)/Glu-tRNA(Gln) amidotransferase subunit GatC [Chloroflexi bacterium]|nr:Asp-tRNA(Asn)/Glu-tRNA(Gln) amidotransferase subunit GatC [Chloroflexota bacterium]
MSISREDVQHVAALARLGLSEEDIENLSTQLSDILDNFQILSQLDTSNIPPTAQVISLQNVVRDDVAGTCSPREEILLNAPRKERGFFRTKAVLEE